MLVYATAYAWLLELTAFIKRIWLFLLYLLVAWAIGYFMGVASERSATVPRLGYEYPVGPAQLAQVGPHTESRVPSGLPQSPANLSLPDSR